MIDPDELITHCPACGEGVVWYDLRSMDDDAHVSPEHPTLSVWPDGVWSLRCTPDCKLELYEVHGAGPPTMRALLGVCLRDWSALRERLVGGGK